MGASEGDHGKRRIPITTRFFQKLQKSTDPDGCWIWTAATNGFYGKMLGFGKRLESAHRISWKLHHGDIPDGLMVDHKCRNTLCVNPKHLQLVTAWESQHLSKDNTNGAKTHCNKGHLLADARIVHRKNGVVNRICRICEKERTKNWYSKKSRTTSQVKTTVQRERPRIRRKPKTRVSTVMRLWFRKLSQEKCEAIRRLYSTGEFSQKQIGEQFGVCNQTVSNVILDKCKVYRQPGVGIR